MLQQQTGYSCSQVYKVMVKGTLWLTMPIFSDTITKKLFAIAVFPSNMLLDLFKELSLPELGSVSMSSKKWMLKFGEKLLNKLKKQL